MKLKDKISNLQQHVKQAKMIGSRYEYMDASEITAVRINDKTTTAPLPPTKNVINLIEEQDQAIKELLIVFSHIEYLTTLKDEQ